MTTYTSLTKCSYSFNCGTSRGLYIINESPRIDLVKDDMIIKVDVENMDIGQLSRFPFVLESFFTEEDLDNNIVAYSSSKKQYCHTLVFWVNPLNCICDDNLLANLRVYNTFLFKK